MVVLAGDVVFGRHWPSSASRKSSTAVRGVVSVK